MFGSGVTSSLSYNLDTAVFDADQVSLSLIGWWISQLLQCGDLKQLLWNVHVLSGTVGTMVQSQCLYVNCEGFCSSPDLIQ